MSEFKENKDSIANLILIFINLLLPQIQSQKELKLSMFGDHISGLSRNFLWVVGGRRDDGNLEVK